MMEFLKRLFKIAENVKTAEHIESLENSKIVDNIWNVKNTETIEKNSKKVKLKIVENS